MKKIAELVVDLPELYQPVYGYPELSLNTSRSCDDRLKHIVDIANALTKYLKRPLRVLDLGCAQGYFSFSLAHLLGANVHGIDFLDKNIALCNALAREQKTCSTTFECGQIQDVMSRITVGQYDLVLGLSVFHHLVYELGLAAVKDMLHTLAEYADVLILENALQEEPLYWASHQPRDPRDLLSGIVFVSEIDRLPNHLSDLKRPLYVASQKFCVIDEKIYSIESSSTDSHALALGTHENSRHYFFSEKFFIKQYLFDNERGEHNRTEFTNEISFLQNITSGFNAPNLIEFRQNHNEALVVMDKLPGQLVLDLIQAGKKIDAHKILISLLEQLESLEKAGFYHNDVRTWNIMLDDKEQVYLIDYGSISTQKRDCAWPNNIYLSFFILVYELISLKVDNPVPLRNINIHPLNFVQPYRNWLERLWKTKPDDWTFTDMHQILKQVYNSKENLSGYAEDTSSDSLWMKEIENALQVQKEYFANVIESMIIDSNSKHRVEMQKIDSMMFSLEQKMFSLEQKSQQLNAVYNSSSWRITKPLRWLSSVFSRLK